MFTDNLKFLRKERNISQQEIADYLNITRQAYNNYENGKREPDYEILLKLGEYFEVTVDDLLNSNIMDTDENLIILNRNAKKMTPEQRKRLIEMAKIMFEEDFE